MILNNAGKPSTSTHLATQAIKAGKVSVNRGVLIREFWKFLIGGGVFYCKAKTGKTHGDPVGLNGKCYSSVKYKSTLLNNSIKITSIQFIA